MITAAFFASALVIHLTTYTTFGGSDAVQAIGLALFFLAFPVLFATIGSFAFSPVPFDRLIELLPGPVKVFAAMLLVYVAADFVLMIRFLPGNPIEQNGHFFFNSHGALTPISLEGYRQGLAYQARLFTGHEMVFFGVAAFVAYQLDRFRRGKIAAIRPMDVSTRPGPLSRFVVLETTVPPDQCVSSLLADLETAPGWSWLRAARLWGSVSADGFWLALERRSRAALVFATGRFFPQGTGTRVEVHLQLKRWGWWSLAASAVAVPVFGAVVDWATGGGHLVAIVFVLVAFILVGNTARLLSERRRLLSAIERVLSARPAHAL